VTFYVFFELLHTFSRTVSSRDLMVDAKNSDLSHLG